MRYNTIQRYSFARVDDNDTISSLVRAFAGFAIRNLTNKKSLYVSELRTCDVGRDSITTVIKNFAQCVISFLSFRFIIAIKFLFVRSKSSTQVFRFTDVFRFMPVPANVYSVASSDAVSSSFVKRKKTVPFNLVNL